MKLNPDCIRDILIAVENNTDFTHSFVYSISNSSIESLANYSHEEIIYHISQCDKANLIDSVQYMDGGDCVVIGDLSPEGHKFLADIRSDTVWNRVKDISKEIGLASLSSITQIATCVATNIIKSHLGLI